MKEITNLDEVDNLLQKMARPGHTFFQLNYFVIGAEPTAQAKMQKCLSEIKARRDSIDAILLEIEEIEDLNSLLHLDLKRSDNKFQAEEREIRVRQVKRKIEANRRHLHELHQKADCWLEEINFLKYLYDQIAEQHPIRAWEDYDVQLEYWNEKLAKEIRERLLLNVAVDINTIKTVLSLPNQAAAKKELLQLAEVAKKQLSDK